MSAIKFKSPLLPIFFIVAVDVLGLTLILPYLPFYAEKFGASPATIGFLFSSFALFQLMSGPLLGSMSDRWGRRKILLLSQIGTLIGFIVLAQAQTLWVIFLARIIDGATAGNLSVAQAYIADVTPQEKRARAFGIIGVAFGLGFMLGPALSGILATESPQYPIYLAMGLSLLSILLTYFLLPEPDFHVDSTQDRKVSIFQISKYLHQFRRKNVGTFLFQFFSFHFAFSLFFTGFPLFLSRRFFHDGIPYGPKEVGYLYAYSGLIGAVVQGGAIGKLVSRFGEVNMVLVSFCLLVLGYFTLSASFHLAPLLIAGTLSALGHAIVRPSLTSLLSRQVTSTEQGMILGLGQSLNSVAQITAPIIGGVLISMGYLSLWALTSALVSVMGLILIIRVKRDGFYLGGLDQRGETQSPIP